MSESVHKELVALQEAIEQFPSRLGTTTERSEEGVDWGWAELFARVDEDLTGRRVLTIGRAASRPALDFAARGADYVLACEPPGGSSRVQPLEPRRSSRVEHLHLRWDRLSHERHGTFHILHCHDLFHRILEPMALLRALHALTATNGYLYIDSMMLADPERSECLRFVPSRHAGDPDCWFIPGRLAFRWMVETAGFRVESEFGEREGPRDRIPVVWGYLRAVRE